MSEPKVDPLIGWTMKVPVKPSSRKGRKGFTDHQAALMRSMYVHEKMSLGAIADHFECSTWTVREHLKRLEVPLRNTGGTSHFAQKEITSEQVKQMESLYFDEGKSMRAISKIIGCSPGTVKHYIKDMGEIRANKGPRT